MVQAEDGCTSQRKWLQSASWRCPSLNGRGSRRALARKLLQNSYDVHAHQWVPSILAPTRRGFPVPVAGVLLMLQVSQSI